MKHRGAVKKAISILLTVALVSSLLAVVIGDRITSKAVFDESKAVTYQEYSSKATVENSVLFIGTYIVHKDALNDQLYTKAQDSASQSGQNEIYYKSELSDGQWFEIGDIDNGVKGISSQGKPVTIETINPLFVTYYVGSDGITKDAKTLAAVNPFDIPDPYDLTKLPELEPIWTQYTYSSSTENISQAQFLENRGSKDSGNLRSDVYYYQLLSTFFSLDLRDSETNKYDEQLRRLNDSYIALKAAGNDDEADLVYSLMEKVDANRRALIMSRLAEIDGNLLNTLYTLSTGSYYTPNGSFKDSSSEPNASSQPSYTRKLEDSLKFNYSNSLLPGLLTTWFSRLGLMNMGNGWWTVLQEEEAKRDEKKKEANKNDKKYKDKETVDVNEDAFKPDTSLLEAIGTALSNCSTSYTTYVGKGLVDSEDLISHVIYDYSKQVIEQTSGATVGGPVTMLKNATSIQKNQVNDKDGELSIIKNSLISQAGARYQAKTAAGVNSEYASLMSEGAKKNNLEDQKADLEAERSSLQYIIEALEKREKSENALAFVNERITWTEGLLNGIPKDDFSPMSNASVEAHIAWLKDEAKKIKASDDSMKSEVDKLKEKKEELITKRDSALDNNDLAKAAALDAQIAAVDKDIDDAGGDQGSMEENLLGKAMDKLADDANADLSGIADALAGIGATDALNALAKKAAASGASKDSLNSISGAVAEANEKAGLSGKSGGSGSGSGTGGTGLDGSGTGAGGTGLDGSGTGTGAGGTGLDGSGAGAGGTGLDGSGTGTGAGGTGLDGKGAGTGDGSGSGADGSGTGTGDGSGSGADGSGTGTGDGSGSGGSGSGGSGAGGSGSGGSGSGSGAGGSGSGGSGSGSGAGGSGSGGSESGSGAGGSGSGGSGSGSGAGGSSLGGSGSGGSGAGGSGAGGSGSGAGGAGGSGAGGSGSGAGGAGGSGAGAGGGDASGLGADSTTPTLSADATSISADALEEELEEAMGKDLDEMSDKELAVAGVVASKLGKSGIEAGNTLAKQVATKLYKKNNKYMFNKYTGNGASEYVSLKTISDCTPFRYFYDDSKYTATMTQGSKVYIFKRGSDQMYKESTSTEPEKMRDKVVSQSYLYLNEADALTYFGCEAEYLSGTNYGICLTDTMQKDAEEKIDTIIDAIN